MHRAASSARPFWFALFKECLDPFAEISALTDASIFADGGLNLRIEFSACVIGQQAFGMKKRKRTVLRQLRGEFTGALDQFFRRDDFVDQAHFQGFWRVENAACEQEVASDFFADLPQQKSRDDGGHESNPDLGVAKLGFRYSEREIAEQRKPGTAGDGRAIYRGDC